MAYTSAPENQTYSSKRLPLVYPINLRPASNVTTPLTPEGGQDCGMINILPTKVEGSEQIVGVTRPILEGNAVGTDSNVVRGIYIWEKTAGTTYYFVVVGTKIYTTNTTPTQSGWTNVTTFLTNASTPVRFTEFIDATNVKKLVVVDGVEGYVFTTNAAGTKITDVDFPTPHVPFPVFMNGRLFLAKANTGDIYQSDLNDPAVWTAGAFISSEVYPDDIQALVKVDNYILAVGLSGSEYFYDAANATGTVLARYEGGLLPFGTQLPNSIAYNKNTVVMLANTGDGQAVFKVIEGLKYADINSSFMVSALNSKMSVNWFVQKVLPVEVRGYFFRYNGDLFYVFRFNGADTSATAQSVGYNNTFAYSFSTKMWTELQFGGDTSANARASWPVNCAAASSSSSTLQTWVGGNYPIGGVNYAFVCPLAERTIVSETAVDNFDLGFSVANDYVYQEVRTPNLTFDTINRKFMSRLSIDVETGPSNLTPSTYYVEWNDSDYNFDSWTDPRTLTYNPSGGYFPSIVQLGSFRRRAFKIYCTDGTVTRWNYMEVDINKGQQ